jgi:hypothetical protein
LVTGRDRDPPRRIAQRRATSGRFRAEVTVLVARARGHAHRDPGTRAHARAGPRTGIREALDEIRPDVLVIDDRLVESDMPDRGAGVRVIVVGVGEDARCVARSGSTFST